MKSARRLILRNPIFVPGNRRDMLQKAAGFYADAIVPDLEDSVPDTEKAAARDTVADVVEELAESKQRIIVRINSLETGMAEEDAEATVGPYVFGISAGKIRSPKDIVDYDHILGAVEAKKGMQVGLTRFIPWIETAAAVHDARDIALSSARVAAITFGAEDYTRDIGVQRTASGAELKFPRGMVALAAHAAGVTPLDTPFVNFRDDSGLRNDIAEALKLGYKGKFAIHPGQLETIRRMFGPSLEELEHARRVVAAWEDAAASGRGAIDLDGAMVDLPVVERARDLLSEAT